MTTLDGRMLVLALALGLAAAPFAAQAQMAPSKAEGVQGQAAAMRAHQGFGPLHGAGPLQGRGIQQGAAPFQGFGPLMNNGPVVVTTPVQGGSK